MEYVESADTHGVLYGDDDDTNICRVVDDISDRIKLNDDRL